MVTAAAVTAEATTLMAMRPADDDGFIVDDLTSTTLTNLVYRVCELPRCERFPRKIRKVVQISCVASQFGASDRAYSLTHIYLRFKSLLWTLHIMQLLQFDLILI